LFFNNALLATQQVLGTANAHISNPDPLHFYFPYPDWIAHFYKEKVNSLARFFEKWAKISHGIKVFNRMLAVTDPQVSILVLVSADLVSLKQCSGST
jgi:hypothetical protein